MSLLLSVYFGGNGEVALFVLDVPASVSLWSRIPTPLDFLHHPKGQNSLANDKLRTMGL